MVKDSYDKAIETVSPPVIRPLPAVSPVPGWDKLRPASERDEDSRLKGTPNRDRPATAHKQEHGEKPSP
jgi:hypothetical protein